MNDDAVVELLERLVQLLELIPRGFTSTEQTRAGDALVRRVDALEVCSAAGGLLRTLEAGRPTRPADIKAAQKVIDGAAWHEKTHKKNLEGKYLEKNFEK